jgi:predicted ATP-dependent protease
VFKRCTVNLIVDHEGETHAPVIYEDLPTHPNLLGRIEHVAHLGTLLTDFTLIKAGALHRANGGYLLLDVRRLLQQPFAWEELKRALRAREIRIDGVPQAMTWMTTASIEPEPIPLDVKVILVGERLLFYLLGQLDPDVAELFRIQADFNDRVERTADVERRFASALATVAAREGLLPLEADAIAAVIDHAARTAEAADRVSTNLRTLTDLCREADRLARDADPPATAVARAHVVGAIEARRRRAGRLAQEMRESIVRGLVRVETDGRVVGQVNGLSVVELGDATFGWPTRITAQARLGRGDVIDIEREVELGGPIHSKGVLILGGFLGGRFGRCAPLALEATLVFEQSYGQVEGDSASMAELCALLSAIGGLEMDQATAVTGSVDQLGRSQAIGGANDKIEGFFDLCLARGLTGEQGVLIPSANVQTLMLRDDVLAAVTDGRFTIRTYDTVDEAMTCLTGLAAGEPAADGSYPPDSVNGRVAARLAELAAIAREAEMEREAVKA